MKDSRSLLEVAPGPGYLAIGLAKLGEFVIIGLDISKAFVKIAKRIAIEAGVEVEFQQSSVADISLQMKHLIKYFLRKGSYTKDENVGIISRTAFKEYYTKDEGIGFYIYLRM
jgi:hypothetical protein